MSILIHCWWQIIVAAIIYFALGAAWFNPKVFGTIWMNSHGIKQPTEEERKSMNMGKMFAPSFLCTLIFSAAICWICCASCGVNCTSMGMMHCLKVGFLVGLIGASSISMAYLYQMKPLNAFLTDGLYHVVGSMLAATTLHLLGCC
ncbi:MAG: DUF1761 domain-containing protein [Bacteroidia bacterium]